MKVKLETACVWTLLANLITFKAILLDHMIPVKAQKAITLLSSGCQGYDVQIIEKICQMLACYLAWVTQIKEKPQIKSI